MTYQVIARKWRPQTFDEVTGQEPITRTLRNAIEHQRLHHAYLFSGARGVGKTTTARLLAKGLNCYKFQLPTATPCRTDDPDACKSCREITEGRSLDVREIDAASNTGIDNMRDVVLDMINAKAAVWEGRVRYRVFIVDEVHMLSNSAFNALLKTLEEPPELVVFIFATTERHKVPVTILSRCQQFEFRTIPTVKIFESLRLIADAEKISVPDDALREIARSGEGSMRDAQSNFDQVISYSGGKITKDDVEMALGVVGADILIRVIKGIAEHTPAEALAVVDDVVMRGHDLRNFCRDLLAHFRDLLVTKVSGSEELLESAICDATELKRQSALFSESDLVRFFHSLAETETLLKTAAHPRYQLEIGLVKLMEMRRLTPLNQLLDRLTALEEATRSGKAPAAAKGSLGTSSAPAPKVKAAAAPDAMPAASAPWSQTSPISSTTVAGSPEAPAGRSKAATSQSSAGSYSAAATQTAPITFSAEKEAPEPVPTVFASEIEEIKAALEKKRKMFLVTALEGASKASLEGNELCLEFAPDARHLRDTLAKSDNVKILREVGKDVTGRDLGVRFVITDSEGSAAASDAPPSKAELERREKQDMREKAEKDPTVQQMLKTFRGEIVDVKRVDPAK